MNVVAPSCAGSISLVTNVYVSTNSKCGRQLATNSARFEDRGTTPSNQSTVCPKIRGAYDKHTSRVGCCEPLRLFYNINFNQEVADVLGSEELASYRTHEDRHLIQEIVECKCDILDPARVRKWTRMQSSSFRLQFETQATVCAAIEGAFDASDRGSVHEVHLCSLVLLLFKV